ncbi:unnamed protein product [marine sediment metagenome]|uniref:Uncharacterized protein n=1 Tax=marine sediment metagenome TaxID=412755 RepID=X1QF32_9ZZZZ
MVTIIGFEKRENKKKEEFNVLILQGDVVTIISKETGKPYLTARKTSIPCTFDDIMAKTMIGKEMPGEILKVDCEEYEFTIPSTGKKIKLAYTYVYNQEPAGIEETVMG